MFPYIVNSWDRDIIAWQNGVSLVVSAGTVDIRNRSNNAVYSTDFNSNGVFFSTFISILLYLNSSVLGYVSISITIFTIISTQDSLNSNTSITLILSSRLIACPSEILCFINSVTLLSILQVTVLSLAIFIIRAWSLSTTDTWSGSFGKIQANTAFVFMKMYLER